SPHRNPAGPDPYEPGSTFKVVTYAAALTDHVVTPNTSFTLAPSIQVADRTISDAEPRPTETAPRAREATRSRDRRRRVRWPRGSPGRRPSARSPSPSCSGASGSGRGSTG